MAFPVSHEIKEYRKADGFTDFILGADVGGTNTNIGIFGAAEKPVLLFSIHFKSQELSGFRPAIKAVLEHCKKKEIKIGKACIGAAGIVSENQQRCELINVKWIIDAKELEGLKDVFIINDFQAIGYGINVLGRKDIVTIRNGSSRGTKAVIGAGTGLGKCVLVFSGNSYLPMPSEGGHCDFPVFNELEFELAEYIRKKVAGNKPLSYEELLSGRGIEAIYEFVRKKHGLGKEARSANEIASNWKKDYACRETLSLFTKFFGRCSKNFVLDIFATGGLYIAGGIAAKNPDIFKTKEFLNEFNNAYKEEGMLKKIPVFVITNYNVGMYGAAFAANLRG